ncbi:glycine zipper 2TM domain-containing protein [Sulfurimonas autotrophica]|uniref:17 kDa surface antigen n=1 Tax=Sulfurimonas autotrophica (strain ATCC BAA-671 / DSM 16294 / JCM 11897 / OK10) TaxID=563040 RepID=E0UP55_SULAO|nr:glycine zipper 2TM domain-containing protein [Sulfurimonas autotrophica]ADN08519.1 17 kDa surface antigen [Sulfurimonas autotrophica DSM 16294]
MKKFLVTVLLGSLFFSGCATRGLQEMDANSVNYEMSYQVGIVKRIKPVVIKDNGAGTFVGAITGAVLGSLVGKGRGNTLATLGGGLGGAYVGNQIGKANAQELSVALNDGRNVVVLAKGKDFYVGQRVRIVKHDGRVYSVEAF